MAWTAPMTALDNTIFTSAQWNTHVRDNLLQSAVAKATTAGRWFVATGANAIAERAISSTAATGSSTTTSTSYTDLASADGPAVTITTGTQALVMYYAEISHSVADADSRISYAVSSATTVSASDTWACIVDGRLSGSGNRTGAMHLHTGLNAGSNVFTMKYRVGVAGTGTFAKREIIVMAL